MSVMHAIAHNFVSLGLGGGLLVLLCTCFLINLLIFFPSFNKSLGKNSLLFRTSVPLSALVFGFGM